ncbi:hypothetical protein AB0A69_24895 [Streptomyces sp. NPDC045431]|uniref:hypothetical protein n=1 Tax=Streptomyces sp. NPDC045431 TaxID=3155613 RepID=UPI0033F08816
MSEPHKGEDRFEQYGPDGPLHVNDHRTGNGIVNDGDRLGGLHGLGGLDAQDGFGEDELALRRMLQGAVGDLRPSDGALDHLRKAVPARRARKRQALVGMAAAALLFGTALPAFVHVASSGGTSDDRPVNAGHGEDAQGGTGEETGGEGGEAGPGGGVTGGGEGPGGPGGSGRGDAQKPPESASGAADGTVGGGAVPPAHSVPPSTPVCSADQLAVATAQAGEPDAEGKVYGTFRIANVSGGDCAIPGDGTIGVRTSGAADSGKITRVRHMPGDAATGLPDPSGPADGPLLLKPSGSYEVRFAWVPSETCPTTPPDGGPSPDPSPSADGGATSTGANGSDGSTGTAPEGTEPQLATEDGTPADGSVTITHTPDAGSPTAEATIPNACAGTVYYTAARVAQ